MGRLDGKVAMVTGSGGQRGFGRAIARRLGAEGADLVLTDVSPAGTRVVATKPTSGWRGLEAVADEVRETGRRAVTALVDVRAADQVKRAVDLADRTFGRIDILVNNAAAPPGADRVPVVELPEEAWRVILETNLTGTYLCSKAAAGLMVARRTPGRIINMSSNCGKIGYARLAAYCASKFGVIGFTQALALELAPHAITGPLHAGHGYPHWFDRTLNPTRLFADGGFDNFGEIRLDAGGLTVRIIDVDGRERFETTLLPEPAP
jgi:NAD(P)-dependent dehydrogenase (short-subunit alcohol dehydrogenase family)